MTYIVLTVICLVSTCLWQPEYKNTPQRDMETCERSAIERNAAKNDGRIQFICAYTTPPTIEKEPK